MPERRWRVTCDDVGIAVVDHTGSGGRIGWDDIGLVSIETDDSGPWRCDLYWWLHDRSGLPRVVWPQGATGEQPAIDALFALPGFDHEAAVRAMASTDVATFVLWRHDDRHDADDDGV